ncbi:FUSC family protein [Streptomyces eurocidicus]|nr:FUSC family protein [Streptomyces eurocidicus]MBF6051386.1 FUSC family protein [Streptomyces eurocidicus]
MRLNRPGDIWYKPAFSAATAMAAGNGGLLAAGRPDLALYASAGALCALYGHALPYAARARALAVLVLGMAAGVGVALTAASLTGSAAVLVLVAALLAGAQRALCDASRIGPPGNIVLTFVTAGACFAPQRLGQVPLHLGLVLACGAFAWLVCMAPALVRPYGPERVVAARALEATARLLRADGAAEGDGVPRARHAATAALHTARRGLAHTRTGGHPLAGLEALLLRAESATAREGADGPAAARRHESWARDLRAGRPLPDGLRPTAGSDGSVPAGGVPAAEPARTAAPRGSSRAAHAPGAGGTGSAPAAPDARPARRWFRSPSAPVAVRVTAGAAAAGWAASALGAGHPYWAVVTAAAVFQANTALSWQRALQRVLGNLLGLLLFALLPPAVRTGHPAMVLLVVVLLIGAEASIVRNYWLASVCVTPMALLLTEFGGARPARELIGDRWTDTLIGAAVGLLVCVLVTNRRATDRTDAALGRLSEARAAALALLDAPHSAHEAGRARDRLATALVELREAADVAAGEWWQRTLPAERVRLAERDGHRALAALVHRLAPAAA